MTDLFLIFSRCDAMTLYTFAKWKQYLDFSPVVKLLSEYSKRTVRDMHALSKVDKISYKGPFSTMR